MYRLAASAVAEQNDVCLTKRGCDDACANLIRPEGEEEEEGDEEGRDSGRGRTVAVTTPEAAAEAASSASSEDNTVATTAASCCNGGAASPRGTIATVEYGRNEAVA